MEHGNKMDRELPALSGQKWTRNVVRRVTKIESLTGVSNLLVLSGCGWEKTAIENLCSFK